jgi:hypothetical protein
VTLTPTYHTAAHAPGLRYRVLFPALVAANAGAAQAALRAATPCGPECVVSQEIAELAINKLRGTPIVANAAEGDLEDSAPTPAAEINELVQAPAAPYFD